MKQVTLPALNPSSRRAPALARGARFALRAARPAARRPFICSRSVRPRRPSVAFQSVEGPEHALAVAERSERGGALAGECDGFRPVRSYLMPRFSVATPATRCTLCARHPGQQLGRAEVSATSSQASGAASDGLFARRLAAIAFIDVVGYSALMSRDEDRTHARWRTLRREVIEPRLEAHRGSLVKSTGDGVLVEFSSVLDAVGWSRDVQAAVREAPGDESLPQLERRIAVHPPRALSRPPAAGRVS